MPKKLGGRPQAEIDKKEFEKLCALQCTQEEICYFFDVSDKTLQSWCKRTYNKGFSEVFSAKRTVGKISLRRAQFQMAKKNPTMAIWMGKQYLGQQDIQTTQLTGRDGAPIETKTAVQIYLPDNHRG